MGRRRRLSVWYELRRDGKQRTVERRAVRKNILKENSKELQS